jgi:hypothetical protein
MKRRDFFKLLTATPAAFLVSKYGMPNGSAAPAERFEALQLLDRFTLTLPPEGPLAYTGGGISKIKATDKDGRDISDQFHLTEGGIVQYSGTGPVRVVLDVEVKND